MCFWDSEKTSPELCNASDISAFPSKIEGLGLAGIEAMAAGVPLISSNVHGILDYVIDGETVTPVIRKMWTALPRRLINLQITRICVWK